MTAVKSPGLPPPEKARALAALDVVQRLSAQELDVIIEREIGVNMLGVMKAVARAQMGDDELLVAKAVHLLVFGWLLRRETTPA